LKSENYSRVSSRLERYKHLKIIKEYSSQHFLDIEGKKRVFHQDHFS
jgi:hypothetical protein